MFGNVSHQCKNRQRYSLITLGADEVQRHTHYFPVATCFFAEQESNEYVPPERRVRIHRTRCLFGQCRWRASSAEDRQKIEPGT